MEEARGFSSRAAGFATGFSASTSAITTVTVFPRGAEVTRTAQLKVAPGEHVLVFKDLHWFEDGETAEAAR